MTARPDGTLRVFDGGTAIVTGGASGIGLALAQALAERGCEVVLADRQIESAEEAAAAIGSSGGTATASELDVTDADAVERLVRETAERTGRLDFVFNNAGIGIGGPLERQTADDWRLIVDVNLLGVANGVQAAYPLMIEQGFGHIVNTSSLSGLFPTPGGVSYAATKHALIGLSTTLRAEAASKGIRVTVLCPGVVRTPALEHGGKYGKHVGDLSVEQEREIQEARRPISAEEFASKALDRVAKNDNIVVIPSSWRVAWWINRLSPSLSAYLARRDYEKTLKATRK